MIAARFANPQGEDVGFAATRYALGEEEEMRLALDQSGRRIPARLGPSLSCLSISALCAEVPRFSLAAPLPILIST